MFSSRLVFCLWNRSSSLSICWRKQDINLIILINYQLFNNIKILILIMLNLKSSQLRRNAAEWRRLAHDRNRVLVDGSNDRNLVPPTGKRSYPSSAERNTSTVGTCIESKLLRGTGVLKWQLQGIVPLGSVLSSLWCRFPVVQSVSSVPLSYSPAQTWTFQVPGFSFSSRRFAFPVGRNQQDKSARCSPKNHLGHPHFSLGDG